MIPALVIYLLIPSKAEVEGPLKGFKIKLSGGIAAYFVLVLIAWIITSDWLEKPESPFEVWTVSGVVYYENPLTSSKFKKTAREVRGGTTPPEFQVSTEGNFTMNVLVKPGPGSEKRQFPTLIFNHPEHQETQIILNNSKTRKIEIDTENKHINLPQDIVLEKFPEIKGDFLLGSTE